MTSKSFIQINHAKLLKIRKIGAAIFVIVFGSPAVIVGTISDAISTACDWEFDIVSKIADFIAFGNK